MLLFTATYPFDAGAEQTFLDLETKILVDSFDKVIVVPGRCSGTKLNLPEGMVVDDSYAASILRANPLSLVAKVLRSRLFYMEIYSRPDLLFYPRAILRLVKFVAGVNLTSEWMRSWFAKKSGSNPICYTYWFDHITLGVGLIKKQNPGIRLVSRAHGYDLYEEYYYHPPYWPCRPLSLSLLDALYIDSYAGTEYMRNKYPAFRSIYETALLGVPDPGIRSAASTDGTFRIVSCSLLDDVKRVDLLLEGVVTAARLRPNQQFEWTHIGNGVRRTELQQKANASLPINARGRLPGYDGKQALYQFYRDNPVDVFINVSATEGTPVSIMEAISCGIPVLATSVGGNTEIVSELNGLLLPKDPSAEDIGQAIIKFIDECELSVAKRENSYQLWKTRYNAASNYEEFISKLKFIGKD